MKLLKVIEKEVKHWDIFKTCSVNEMRILNPTNEDLEKAIAMCNINDIDTLIIYKEE